LLDDLLGEGRTTSAQSLLIGKTDRVGNPSDAPHTANKEALRPFIFAVVAGFEQHASNPQVSEAGKYNII
jgi:hypothetical protein